MRNISRALLLVGMILAFVYVGVFVFAAIASFGAAIGSNFAKGFYDYIIKEMEFEGDPETLNLVTTIICVSMGVTFIILAIASIPTAIVALMGRKNPSKGLLIANIVFGALCGTYFSIAGGVLGLIANAREARRAAAATVIDAQ